MFRNLKIGTKIILPIILVAVIILSGMTFYSYYFTTNLLESQAINQLETTAQLIKKSIANSLSEQKEKYN